MRLLSDQELGQLSPAEDIATATPLPVQVVSSDEFFPIAQTERQKRVETRLNALADEHGAKRGLSRRQFFKTSSGMAAAFMAMNDVYGPLYGVNRAEAATQAAAEERLAQLEDQFVMDVHTHFLRDDTRLEGFVRAREAVGRAGWNPALVGKPQTIADLKYDNWFKEMYLEKAGLATDRFAALKRDYLARGADPSNRRYGYVLKG